MTEASSQPLCPTLSVIVLTYNEEENLPPTLESLRGVASSVYVLDSDSTDRTQEIARDWGAEVATQPPGHWAHLRNWALDTLPISTVWVLFLDADERLTPALKEELSSLLNDVPTDYAGFYLPRRFMFLGKWLRFGGYYPGAELRLLRHGRVRVVPAGDREYFRADGKVRSLRNAAIHEDLRGLSFWVKKHNRISELAADTILDRKNESDKNEPSGQEANRLRHMLRSRVLGILPPLVQPFFLFLYRYILRLGFLDGRPGFVYCFFHAWWYPTLVAAKVRERRQADASSGDSR